MSCRQNTGRPLPDGPRDRSAFWQPGETFAKSNPAAKSLLAVGAARLTLRRGSVNVILGVFMLRCETLVVGGGEVELFRTGAGPALLYLHDGDGVEAAAPFLARLGRRFSVIAPSHPGFGASALPAHFSGIDDLAFFYLDLIDQLDLNDLVVVGASFGAWIAAEIAVCSVARLARIVLVGPVGAKLNDEPVPELADIFSLAEEDLRGRLFHTPAVAPDYSAMPLETVNRMARNREALTLFAWAPTLCNPKLRSRLHRIRRPALVLRGSHDGVVPLHYARAFTAALPQASAVEVERAGHYAHVERPEACVDLINVFADATPARVS